MANTLLLGGEDYTDRCGHNYIPEYCPYQQCGFRATKQQLTASEEARKRAEEALQEAIKCLNHCAEKHDCSWAETEERNSQSILPEQTKTEELYKPHESDEYISYRDLFPKEE